MFIGCQPIQRGGSPIYQPIAGGLVPGIYASDSQGNRTYTKTGTTEWSGVTFDSTYDLYWFEVFSDGSQSAVQSILVNALVAGQNVAIPITGVEFSATVIMYLATSLTVTNTPNEWFWNISGVSPTATISGGAWSEQLELSPNYITYSLYSTYVGVRLPEAGEYGDYSFNVSQTDPNGVVTQGSNNGTILARWTPKLFVSAYDLTGVWDDVVEPPLSGSGYETISVEYYPGADYALDENGNLVYDVDGKIGFIAGALPAVQVTGLTFATGDNSIIVTNVADSGGTQRDVEAFLITRTPHITNNGLTTIDEETYGTTYAATDILTIDAGLSNETTATPEEAPYTFISADYRVYNFTATYTYPNTTVSTTENYDITYKEKAVEPFGTPLAWQYMSDDIVTMANPEADQFVNYNPTGTVTVVDRGGTTNVNDTTDMYDGHSAESQRIMRHARPFGQVMNTAFADAPYVDSVGGISDTAFKPEETFVFETWVKDAGSYFLGSRGNSGFGDVTGVYADAAGVIYWIIGGQFSTTQATVDQTKWNHVVGQIYFNGSAWASDLFVNGVAIHINKTTEHGTTATNRKIVLGAKWNTASEVDPATDAMVRGGGSFPYFRLGSTPLTQQQVNALYVRNKRYFVVATPGDSVTAGTGAPDPWGELTLNNSEDFYQRIQIVDYSVSGQRSYQSLPTTPFTGYSAKAPWVGASRDTPSVEQDAEYVYSSSTPEMVVEGFTQNDVRAGAVIKNPSPTGIGENVGWTTYGDELYWCAKHKEAYWTDKGAQYFWLTCGAVTDGTTLIGEDNLPLEDALRAVHDGINDNTSDTNILNWQDRLRVSDLDNSLQPVYDVGDATHYTQAAHDDYYANRVNPLINPNLESSRDTHFDPIVVIVSPADGYTYFMNPVDVEWTRDGTTVNDQSTFTEGTHTLTRQYTNSAGRTGSDSIQVTKESDTYPDDLAAMNYDSKDGVYTLFDSDTTVDDWRNNGTLSGTRAFLADTGRMEVDVNAEGVRGFKGNKSTGDRTLKMTETSGETYKGTEFCMYFCFEYQNAGPLEMLFDRKVTGDTDGFWLYTNSSTNFTFRWVENTASLVFEQQFTGFTNGDLVQVFVNVNANAMNIYVSNGESSTSQTLKTMATVDAFWLGSLEGGSSRSDAPIYAFKCYPREITTEERPLFQQYFVDKYTPSA